MRRVRQAFTLVEILIVVIVLGILAAIVVPQFTDASTDAKISSLTTNLQIIRGQVELYKIQQGGYPTLQNFVTALTTKTTINGKDYGPYLQAIPHNPFTGTNDVTADNPAATKAWYYDQTTGDFRANDSQDHRTNY